MKRCEGALQRIDGRYEQCDAVAEGGSDFRWECREIGNKKFEQIVDDQRYVYDPTKEKN